MYLTLIVLLGVSLVLVIVILAVVMDLKRTLMKYMGYFAELR